MTSPEQPTTSPPRVVVAIDRPGWAFHHIAEQLAKLVPDTLIVPYGELRNVSGDLLICLWWRSLEELLSENIFRRSIVCLYDHYTWPTTVQDMFSLQCAIEKATVVGVANEMIESMLRARRLTTKPVFLVEDGVDCEMFAPRYPHPTRMVLGWCGNSRAAFGEIKGLGLIREACEEARVELHTVDVAAGQCMSHNDMPEWYNGLSAYVCASTAEGTPNPVLEAMACGRPVITTRCGLTPRVVQDGVSGIFAERSVPGLVAAIERMKRTDITLMGRCARRSAMTYDWKHKLPSWSAAIGAALEPML